MTDSRRSDPESDQDSDSQVFPPSASNDSQDSPQELPATSAFQSTELQETPIAPDASAIPAPIESNPVFGNFDNRPGESSRQSQPLASVETSNLRPSENLTETALDGTALLNSEPPAPEEPSIPSDRSETTFDDADDNDSKKLREREPMPSFEELGLPESLLASIRSLEWQQPTRVQAATYRQLADGNDLLVQSQTGTGKTGAFCLPWLAKRYIPSNPKETGVQLLVLVPTRELAKQVSQELISLAKNSNLIVSAIYGGTPMLPQLEQLKQGIHAVIGTPGRVLDHLRRRSLDLSKLTTVILDECDEMLSMGFLEDIRAILEACSPSRQTCLFSATIPDDISRIAGRYLKSPEKIELSSDRISAKHIEHAYYVASSSVKTRDLIDVIVAEAPSFAIIFCNTREETRMVASVLLKEGFPAEALSSDLAQTARERVLSKMRSHKLRFLVATDIAARGIDISHVSHVVNFSFPSSAETYVHRTGRTGRAGRAGQAISLVGPQEIGDFNQITKHYPDLEFNQRFLPTIEELASTRKEEKLDALSRKYSIPVSPEWIQLARHLVSDPRSDRIVAYLLHRMSQIQLDADSSLDTTSPSSKESDSAADRSSSRPSRRGRRSSRSDDGRKRGRHASSRNREDWNRDETAKDYAEQDQSDSTSSLEHEENRDQRDVATEDVSTSDENSRKRYTSRESRRRREPRRKPRRSGGSREPLASSSEASPENTEDLASDRRIEATDNESFSRPQAREEDHKLPSAASRDENEPRSRNRRRRRRGREHNRNMEELDSTADDSSIESTPPNLGEGEEQNKSNDAPLEADSDSERRSSTERSRRRSRNQRRKRSRRNESSDESFGSLDREQPRDADSQSKIVIEIDDSELEIVRSEFGEFDELSELTVKGRRRAFLDELKDRDDVAIEDLSQIDAQDDIDDEQTDNDLAAKEAIEAKSGKAEEPQFEGEKIVNDPSTGSEASDSIESSSEPSSVPNDLSNLASAFSQDLSGDTRPDYDENRSENRAEPSSVEAGKSPYGPNQVASTGQKKRRRRRRSKRNAPAVAPEITAPPHKDFWEVWSTRFSLQDFIKEEDQFGDVQHTEPARSSTKNEPNSRDHRNDRVRSATRRTKSSSDFERDKDQIQSESQEPTQSVRIRLNIGRQQGFKSADIRTLLLDKCGLAGRDIRDLTVRTTSTFFQVSAGSNAIDQLNGTPIGDVILETTVADENTSDIKISPPNEPSPPPPASGQESPIVESATSPAQNQKSDTPSDISLSLDPVARSEHVQEPNHDQSSLNFNVDMENSSPPEFSTSPEQGSEGAMQNDPTLSSSQGTESSPESSALTPSEADVP